MNKQELYKKLDKEQYKLKNNVPFYQPFAVVLNKVRQWVKELKLDEPSLGECELISNEYNICSCCSYNLNNLIKEIVVGCDNDDFECGECGGAVIHQVFWTDKYMNYCPNCGAKIKREK